jgi:hypothetical protein
MAPSIAHSIDFRNARFLKLALLGMVTPPENAAYCNIFYFLHTVMNSPKLAGVTTPVPAVNDANLTICPL